MKRVNQATLLLVALIGTTGCGSSGSDSSAPALKEESQTVQPGVTPESKKMTIAGSVEKGPFIIGSTVTINILSESGENTDSTIVTKTLDDLGNFEFSVDEGALIELSATGYYRNEITGELSTDTLTLRSIYKVTGDERQNANVNLLTHLTSKRVVELLRSESMAFEDAIKKAEAELATAFTATLSGVENKGFSELSIFEDADSESSAYLLTLSSMMYQYAIDKSKENNTSPEAELTAFINEIENDFSEDGELESEEELKELAATQKKIDPAAVTANVTKWIENSTGYKVPDINEFLDTDLDGIANNKDDDDDNDGISDANDTSQFVADFVIADQSVSLNEDSSLEIELSNNLPLGAEVPVVLDITSSPINGVVQGEYPNIKYIPNTNFNGSDEIQFTLSQGQVTSRVVSVSISVLATNDAPEISGNPSDSIVATQVYSFTPIATDVDADELKFEIENLPRWLEFDASTGSLNGTPSNGDFGTHQNITLSVTDGITSIALPAFSITVDYSQLNAPSNLQSSVNMDAPQGNIELNWDPVDFAASYEIEIARDISFTDVMSSLTSDTVGVHTVLGLGSYYWRIRTVNPQGTVGIWSDSLELNVGVFRATFGTDADDRVTKALETADGGYLIFSKSESENVTRLNKLNSQGVEEWTTSADIEIKEAIELTTGQYVAVGSQISANSAAAIIFDQAGNVLKSALFASLPSNTYNEFSSVAESHSTIYLSYRGDCADACTGGDVRKQISLHSLTLDTGEVSAALNWTPVNGYKFSTSAELFRANSGDLVVHGRLGLSHLDETDMHDNSEFVPSIQVLDASLNQKMLWLGEGELNTNGFSIVDAIAELSNGNFVVHGADMYNLSKFALVDSQGNFVSVFSDIMSAYTRTRIDADENGGFSVLVYNTNGEVEIKTYNSNLDLQSASTNLGLDTSIYPREFMLNSDGTRTLIIEDNVNGNTHTDVVVIKQLH
ncbi:Ig-like domain-containing protein [Pseudoalteromonas umbrosa]|uniref:Ig-like domain-containing protein n=1 Tax=Pseudoalteromonas umbrosa TaxID=3048489 RepID=UPI0024C41E48|nr:Ig-like domain-containing protein [Pseudoalteromonas sp. B95]MDK1285797.1 Ig-like domain-containing protein [Pseudoalteromonas sp. B95]